MLLFRSPSRRQPLSAALLCLVAGALLAGVATASAAPSILSTSGIQAEAEYLSGRTLTVSCAPTRLDWTRTVTGAGLPGTESADYYGFSLIPQGSMFLSPYVCEGLRLGAHAATRRQNLLQVAWAVDVLVHESTHMRLFSYDEALVEACAKAGLAAELHRLYGIGFDTPQMRELTSAAALVRATQTAAYRGGSCPTS